MPRPRIDPEKKLTVKITSLFSEPEGKAIDRVRKGRPKSEWIRETVLPFIRAWLR